MLIETKAIVIKNIKYGDYSIISRCFTLAHGLQSFMLKGILKRKKSGIKRSQFQTLTQLSIIYNFTNKKKLKFIKQAKVINTYTTIQDDIVKNTIILFLSEILNEVIKTEAHTPSLYLFIETSLNWLDAKKKVKNFHIIFLIKLIKFLGFFPDINSNGIYFDLEKGSFSNHKTSILEHDADTIIIFKKILGMNFEQGETIDINRNSKNKILEILIKYFEIHNHGFKTPKSLRILNELFDNP